MEDIFVLSEGREEDHDWLSLKTRRGFVIYKRYRGEGEDSALSGQIEISADYPLTEEESEVIASRAPSLFGTAEKHYKRPEEPKTRIHVVILEDPEAGDGEADPPASERP
ncbi:MAG: hypothetical protein ACYS47_02120 [Planctomycetota bacterium]|jgi:hypothetical protein